MAWILIVVWLTAFAFILGNGMDKDIKMQCHEEDADVVQLKAENEFLRQEPARHKTILTTDDALQEIIKEQQLLKKQLKSARLKLKEVDRKFE